MSASDPAKPSIRSDFPSMRSPQATLCPLSPRRPRTSTAPSWSARLLAPLVFLQKDWVPSALARFSTRLPAVWMPLPWLFTFRLWRIRRTARQTTPHFMHEEARDICRVLLDQLTSTAVRSATPIAHPSLINAAPRSVPGDRRGLPWSPHVFIEPCARTARQIFRDTSITTDLRPSPRYMRAWTMHSGLGRHLLEPNLAWSIEELIGASRNRY